MTLHAPRRTALLIAAAPILLSAAISPAVSAQRAPRAVATDRDHLRHSVCDDRRILAVKRPGGVVMLHRE